MSRPSACTRATIAASWQRCNNLRDLGNTLVLVEHDREVIAAADYLLDFGPGAGDQRRRDHGAGNAEADPAGEGVADRAVLSGEKSIPVPTNRRLR